MAVGGPGEEASCVSGRPSFWSAMSRGSSDISRRARGFVTASLLRSPSIQSQSTETRTARLYDEGHAGACMPGGGGGGGGRKPRLERRKRKKGPAPQKFCMRRENRNLIRKKQVDSGSRNRLIMRICPLSTCIPCTSDIKRRDLIPWRTGKKKIGREGQGKDEKQIK